MSLLLKNVLVIDSNSPVHTKQANILVEKGLITSLNGKSAKNELDLKGHQISCGWFDLNANFNDPGNEHREDIESGIKTAQTGGFTDICLIPSTSPPIESKSDVNYLKRKGNDAVELYVSAAISEGLNGEGLTEILDLNDAGAVSFSDGDKPIWNAELLLKALQYTKNLNAPIIQNAREVNISRNTHMHEGRMSTNLGLRGEPSLSEELIIQRDIEILRYSGGHLHFSKISSAKGVDLIKRAKKEGLNITCDVAIHNLIFTDDAIGEFDTNFKSLPPYRTEKDRKALIKGLKEDVIDAICSNHRPLDQESKQLEFDLAEPGNISLQTFLPALLNLSKEISVDILIDKVVNGPRKILKMDPVSVDVGQVAKLTIFDPKVKWILNDITNLSKSRNSPFWNKEVVGKVSGTVNRSYFKFNK